MRSLTWNIPRNFLYYGIVYFR